MVVRKSSAAGRSGQHVKSTSQVGIIANRINIGVGSLNGIDRVGSRDWEVKTGQVYLSFYWIASLGYQAEDVRPSPARFR